MKRLFCILCLLGIIACQNDFDELKDSQQRHITFKFNLDHLFSDVLTASDGLYSLTNVGELSEDYRLRITIYTYDPFGCLIYTKTLLSEGFIAQPFQVRHLQQGLNYYFVFVADIVKYDPFVEYYETWYQLGTKSWNDFYLYADERNDEAVYNSISYSTLKVTPENQSIEVNFLSISYNGFCVFNNLNSIDRLNGYVMYCSNFYLKDLSWQRLNSIAYSFDERSPRNSTYVKPVSLSYADSIITVMFCTNRITGIDSTTISIPNDYRRPFVATINCATLSLDDCKFY